MKDFVVAGVVAIHVESESEADAIAEFHRRQTTIDPGVQVTKTQAEEIKELAVANQVERDLIHSIFDRQVEDEDFNAARGRVLLERERERTERRADRPADANPNAEGRT